jgi:hypothetical protein
LASSLTREDVRKIVLWTINMPALAFWPFVSAFPLFTLLNNSGSWTSMTVQWAFLITGFWAVFAAGIFIWFVKSDEARRAQSEKRKEWGLKLAHYATLWTAAYLLASWLV